MTPPPHDYQSPRYDYESESDQYVRSGSTRKRRSVQMDNAPARSGRSRSRSSTSTHNVDGIQNRCNRRNRRF